jgi:peptidoglycan/xylan/chitin deacetylase (PgdA/CDA1 family)
MGNINEMQSVIRRMRDSGHCVASHGFYHQNMPSLGYDGQVNNLRQLDDAIGAIIGLRPRYFRPPYGAYDDSTRAAARAIGHDIIMWNIDTLDWSHRNPDASMNHFYQAMGGANPGAQSFIPLQHDIWPESVNTLTPRAIEYIRSRGFRLVDLGTCLTGSINGCYR